MLNNSKYSNQGFTFVESLIALVILGIMMIGGIVFYYQANALYYIGLNSRIVASIASSQLEVCKNLGYSNIPTAATATPAYNYCPTNDPNPPTVNLSEKLTGTKFVTVSNPLPIGGVNYRLVTVTISWTDPSKGAQSVSFQTYVGA